MSYPATHAVHTVNGPVYCCDKHAQQLIKILRSLGTHTYGEPCLTEETECSNCIQENKPAPNLQNFKSDSSNVAFQIVE